MPKIHIPIYPKKDLYQWGPIPAVPYYLLNPGRAVVQEVYKHYRLNWAEGMMVYFDNNKCLWYNRQSEIDDNGFKAAKLVYQNKASERRIKKRYVSVIKKIDDFRKYFTPQKLKQLPDQKLGRAYQTVQTAYNLFWSVATLFELAGYGATAYLQSHARHLPPPEPGRDPLQILTSPADLTFYQKEEVKFLNLLARLKPYIKLKSARAKLGQHADKYNWLLNNFATGKPLGVNYFISRAKATLKKHPNPKKTADKIQTDLRVTNRRRKILIEQISHQETKFYAVHGGNALALHDDRKGWQMRMETVYYYFLQEFSRRFKAKADDIAHLVPDELNQFINKQKAIRDFPLAGRRKLMIAYVAKKSLQIITGKQAKAIVLAYEKLQQTDSNNQELKGLVAATRNHAIITGKTIVVREVSELKKMKPGFILVAQFTSPDFIMAIRKAKAIITDIGGLNSHAAIVSRELGIPCLVGTKVATKIFKDGDTAEVDTDKGTVKKL